MDILRHYSCEIQTCSILWGICFVIMIGLFFGLNYPEIQIAETFVKTQCLIISSIIKSRYCCDYSSYQCVQSPEMKSCESMKKNMISERDPEQCRNNTDLCAPEISACNYGYKCCYHHCNTCSSCSTNTKGRTTCNYYPCMCNCISWESNSFGMLRCDICYTGILRLNYTENGNDMSSQFIKDFEDSLTRAEDFAKTYMVGRTTSCFYDARQPSIVILDTSYSKWKWALTGSFMALVVLPFFIIMGLFIRARCNSWRAEKRDRECPPRYDDVSQTAMTT